MVSNNAVENVRQAKASFNRTGYLAFPLAEAFPQASVYGIDIAETVIAQNRERARDRQLTNPFLTLCEMRRIRSM